MDPFAVIAVIVVGVLAYAAGLYVGRGAARSSRAEFARLAAESLRANNDQFLALAETRMRATQDHAAAELAQREHAVGQLVAPLQEALAKVEQTLGSMEHTRISSQASLIEQLGAARRASESLESQTRALVTALRAPQSRGQWGEMQLRRVVEVAGMVEHCDFDEQSTLRTADGSRRPDLVVHLSGDRHVVVDAKVSLSAFLEAAATSDPDVHRERMQAHARHLRNHVDDLAGQDYGAQLPGAAEFVVLFVPGEAFLAPALEHDPGLLEYAASRRIVLATPTILITMLRTVALSWRQDAVSRHATEVLELSRQIYDRLATLAGHVDKLGRSVGRVVQDYNAALGSLEGRVLVTARRLATLKVVDAPLDSPAPVDVAPRPVTAPEFLAMGYDEDEDDDWLAGGLLGGGQPAAQRQRAGPAA
ncbi:MAG: DNA recombination protein RmuC [Actinomycetota bacterium]|nr:MAG: DNA recombination protein RmuC [Actinomycetota bacterium]